jgi:midasin
VSTGVFRDRDVERSKLVELMMSYVEWFNGDICSDPTGPCCELTLSLRDILTWARFLVVALERNANLGLWDAYFQGACLMHLDGLGLGTSLAKNDATTTRKRAESFLLGQVQPFGSLPKSTDGRFQLVDGRFGTGSFWIETGTHPILPDEAFNLEAPTTATNIFRVLRAMQLSKPVLLEGSPGVGKTSLVAALAAACGHNLVRINLSEQTDMSDLLGGDLPVPEAGNGVSGATFKWCDGVLLSAIKAGAWVLLDELNLASQSVLEGLNSCLDHRASIFIPELGRSFDCPPTFRVFSAQNPLGQGGGRKGLPKSFLNRFTKVYVEALCDIDLRSIVCTKFSTLPTKLLDNIVSFNSRVHRETCELQSFGHTGSPWEFNLRDVFRWCELLSTTTTLSARFVRDLYQLLQNCERPRSAG